MQNLAAKTKISCNIPYKQPLQVDDGFTNIKIMNNTIDIDKRM